MTENLDPVLGGRVQSSDPVLGGVETLKRALASDDPQVLSRVVEQLSNYGAEGIDLLIGKVQALAASRSVISELLGVEGGEDLKLLLEDHLALLKWANENV